MFLLCVCVCFPCSHGKRKEEGGGVELRRRFFCFVSGVLCLLYLVVGLGNGKGKGDDSGRLVSEVLA